MKRHVDIDWAFHSSLEPHKNKLIKRLRQFVQDGALVVFDECLDQLNASSPEVEATTQGVFANVKPRGQPPLYLFLGMIVNRKLPSGAVVFVAPTQEIRHTMADAWATACEEKLGARPPVVN